MKRRTFVKTTSAGLLAGMFFPSSLLAGNPAGYPIGLQLYTLRDEIVKDLGGTLKKIADIGYNTLEAAGYQDGLFYGLQPAEFKKLVEGLGMKVTSSHLTFSDDEVPDVMLAHKDAGIKNLVWPWIGQEDRKSIEQYSLLAAKFNTIGKLCRENGLHFGYHNHAFEFDPIDGKIPYNILLEQTNPDHVFMQLDLYWIIYAGHDPLEWFEKYPGRFHQWHVKDMKAGKEKNMTEVGTGIIDYKKIFDHSAQAGMRSFFMEQDSIDGDPYNSIQTSYSYLKTMLG